MLHLIHKEVFVFCLTHWWQIKVIVVYIPPLWPNFEVSSSFSTVWARNLKRDDPSNLNYSVFLSCCRYSMQHYLALQALWVLWSHYEKCCSILIHCHAVAMKYRKIAVLGTTITVPAVLFKWITITILRGVILAFKLYAKIGERR